VRDYTETEREYCYNVFWQFFLNLIKCDLMTVDDYFNLRVPREMELRLLEIFHS
jgi:hypothetical protein